MSSYPASRRVYAPAGRASQPRGFGIAAAVAVLLGIAVAVLAVAAVVATQAADEARDEAKAASARPAAEPAAHDDSAHADSGNVSLPLQSFAGKTAENAEELAAAHETNPAVLPRFPPETWSRST
jgi:hypothetical protein